MTTNDSIHGALQAFAEAVTAKTTASVRGAPEDRLRAPFENFMACVARIWKWKILCIGEAHLPDRPGRPDYAVQRNDLLTGYIEIKAPGTGVNAKHFKGHNRKQFKRFKTIPNMLYTDGNEWALYRGGVLVGAIVRLRGDIASDGKGAASLEDTRAVASLLHNFFSWESILPTNRKGKIDLKGFAAMLAPLCRMLRDDVTDALSDAHSPLIRLAADWRQLLFPNASNDQFADAYAQTVTFALLLGRSIGAEPLTLLTAQQTLSAQHNLLSRALQVLTDDKARTDLSASLDLLLRVIGAVPPGALEGPDDPWLYFYEDFLAAYDPELRKNAGVYYTPVEVVRAQVRLVDDLLTNHLNKPRGFADQNVVTLDPAAGTGTYLLGIVEHTLARVKAEQGAGAAPGQATALADNLHGFELMVGPYAVAELRVSRALRDHGAELPVEGTHIYLNDTLGSPHTKPPQIPLFLQPIAEQRTRALNIKSKVPVLVCLGNPPYDRHEAARSDNGDRTGSWVRWGEGNGDRDAILHDFIAPAIAAGHGIHVKNLYNLYVYFWRWALWKVFEHETAGGPGIVSFITASSYLGGDAFCGMREHMRRICDEIWIIDLGGEGRGTHKSDNVFAIQTPVAIAVAVRTNEPMNDGPANVHYARVEGTREEKLAALDSIDGFSKVNWQNCSNNWQAPFRPRGEGVYFSWPLLADLMPWQHSGIKAGRTWVIAPEEETLNQRCRDLFQVRKEKRSELFKDSPTGRKVHETATQLPPSSIELESITDIMEKNPAFNIVRFAYRSFDRQFIIGDARFLDRPGPVLWHIHGNRQIYLTTLFSHALGAGPALTSSAMIPDLHHFRGSFGAKTVIPLYRTADASQANILPGLLDQLRQEYGRPVAPEDFVAYIYGVLAHPAFAAGFHKELETNDLRVPITRDPALFEKIQKAGARLLWLHTYGERFIPKGKHHGHVPPGSVRCVKAVPGHADGYPERFRYNGATQTLHIGKGEFSPVTPEIYEFEVSGLKVVQSWLKYRMKKGAGRKSSPLDNIRPERWTSRFTTELLELLWVLEATIRDYPAQKKSLEEVLGGELFDATQFPEVPDQWRKSPSAQRSEGDGFHF